MQGVLPDVLQGVMQGLLPGVLPGVLQGVLLQWSTGEIMISHCNSVLQCVAAWCNVLPTDPAPRAVCRRCRHTPSCPLLSTPAHPYLGDSLMPVVSCNHEAGHAVSKTAHEQRCAADIAQHLHPCGPACAVCVYVCVCACQFERERR